jgi:hypothetical protein
MHTEKPHEGDCCETSKMNSNRESDSLVESNGESESDLIGDDMFSDNEVNVTQNSPKDGPNIKHLSKHSSSNSGTWVEVKTISQEEFGVVGDALELRTARASDLLNEAALSLCHEDDTPFNKRQSRCNAESVVLVLFCAARARFHCTMEVKIRVNFEPFHCSISKKNDHEHMVDYHKTEQGKKKSQSGTWGIALHLRPFIQELVIKRQSPKEILRAVRGAQLQPLPTLQQLRNFAAQVRKRCTSDLDSETLSEFLEWVHTHQYAQSTADDEMFVLPNALLPGSLSWKDSASTLPIVCVLSTKILLRNAIAQQDSCDWSFLAIDGTYNLLANGWPTLIVGTVDTNQKFRLVALGISSKEDESSFKAMLGSISAGISLCFPSRKLKADYTMQDGAKAIFLAVQDVLAPKCLLNCWFHVKQALRKKRNDFHCTDNYDIFARDLEHLQVCFPSKFIMFLLSWKNNLILLLLVFCRLLKQKLILITEQLCLSKSGKEGNKKLCSGSMMNTSNGGNSFMPVLVHQAYLALTMHWKAETDC